ncbi:mitochondrial intermediate peptidase-like [Gigantopelta aegis]|uniref:mitochondrial intermediate peptidase-like n=1 Tax=Gigantopelta aegis TaxID=1735272 RepID=UPI001B887F15|nr:mitochondrial intermediate peptidase-like [Gigantopelta aegis]XP_041355269.1 mitochondrial intermediate peptidase-like [Gigantopelta aegis]
MKLHSRYRYLLRSVHMWHRHTGRRNVCTLSPLAAVFNSKPEKKLNISLRKDNVGLFCFPELKDYTGFHLLTQSVGGQVDSLVEEVSSRNRRRKVVEIFDQLSDSLCRVADMADFVRVAHPQLEFAQAAEETCIKLSSMVEKLNTNVEIHNSLKNVLENGDDIFPTDEVDKRVAELFMFDFQQSGIHLEENKRQMFVKLNESILLLGSSFMQGTQKPAVVAKSSLPDNLRHCFSVDGDNVYISGLFSEHYSPAVREVAYKIFLHPDIHQLDLLDRLLSARHQLANLVEFPSYAHRAVRGTILDTPDSVRLFLDTLSDKISDSAAEDFRKITRLKHQHGITEDLQAWDVAYYTAVGRQERCNISSDELAPYFSLGSCMEGLNNLFSHLYDITFQKVELQHGESWSYDVYKLAVVHRTEGTLGYIYCDFYERPGKANQDCQFTIQCGRQREDGTYQHPIVVLQLNLPQPQVSCPSLLTPGMMENLFHEFGHAMHSMLGRTKYQHVSGTRCSTDFVEVPSVLMEFFASDPRVISSFAHHYKTGEKLDVATIHNLCNSKKMFAASDLQQQVFYSVLDQVYHGPHPMGKSSTDILCDLQKIYYGVPQVEGTARQLRFGHLVGYGAKYYSYLLSRAIASRIWYQCFQQDPFNRSMGEKYRKEILAHGGDRHPEKLIQGMLGEVPTVDYLVDSLVMDLQHTSASLSQSEE